MPRDFAIEPCAGLWFVGCRVNGAGAGRHARAFFRDGRDTTLLAAKPFHHVHHAMMLAIFAAASRKICLGIGGE